MFYTDPWIITLSVIFVCMYYKREQLLYNIKTHRRRWLLIGLYGNNNKIHQYGRCNLGCASVQEVFKIILIPFFRSWVKGIFRCHLDIHEFCKIKWNWSMGHILWQYMGPSGPEVGQKLVKPEVDRKWIRSGSEVDWKWNARDLQVLSACSLGFFL